MRQKYTILKNHKENELIIREFSELDKIGMVLLCEEKFDFESIQSKAGEGEDKLMDALRTDNMYPPFVYATQITKTVLSLFNGDNSESVDLIFDDKEEILRVKAEMAEAVEAAAMMEEIEEESDDIDDLLEDDITDEFNSKDAISTINTSIKIADEESIEVEDD